MKRLATIGLLCLCFTAFTACGKKDNSGETETKHITVNEESPADSQEETQAQTEKETENTTEETTEQIQVPEAVDSMRPLMLGLCKQLSYGESYDSSNAAFFWNSIYAAINGGSWIHPDISLSDDGSGYMVPKEVMAEYANAMFAGTESLPDIPEGVDGVFYDDDFGGYQLMSSDSYAGNLEITNVTETADGYEVETAYTAKGGGVTPYKFVMTSGGSGAFACSIHSVE